MEGMETLSDLKILSIQVLVLVFFVEDGRINLIARATF